MTIDQVIFLGIVFGAYSMGTVLGFGTSILTVTFGAQLLPMDELLPILCPLNLGLSLYLAVRHHKATRWRQLFTRILPLVGLGVPFGLWLFNMRGLGYLKLGFGVFVVVLAALELRRGAPDVAAPLGKKRSALFLFAGGFTHGLFSTGGPFTVYVLGREIEDKGAFRSTISTMFVPLTTALLVDYYAIGLFTERVGTMIVWAVPIVLVGMLIGEWAHKRFDNKTFKRAVWALLFVGGIILTVRSIISLRT